MKGLLPEAIRLRVDKNGFSTPQDEWFRTIEWQEKIWSIIRSESFRSRNIYDVEKVQKLYQQHLNGEKHIAREIWKWVHLELWYQKFIDRTPTSIKH
jgi:asparagine synthase (glutamine-hydrolysing)